VRDCVSDSIRGMLAVRRDCKSRIFQVKVQLREVRPSVWRWVLIPGEATLGELHEVLQIAMGWTNSHLFAVDGIWYGVPDPDPDWGDEEVVDEFRVPLRRYGTPEARHVAAVYDDVAARLLKEAS